MGTINADTMFVPVLPLLMRADAEPADAAAGGGDDDDDDAALARAALVFSLDDERAMLQEQKRRSPPPPPPPPPLGARRAAQLKLCARSGRPVSTQSSRNSRRRLAPQTSSSRSPNSRAVNVLPIAATS